MILTSREIRIGKAGFDVKELRDHRGRWVKGGGVIHDLFDSWEEGDEQDIWGMQLDSGVSTSVEAEIHPDRIEISGRFYDIDGTQLGHFYRQVLPNGIIHNDEFFLDENAQGAGIGKEFFLKTRQNYIDRGVKKITVTPGSDVGGYAWAKMGFEIDYNFNEKQSIIERVRQLATPSRALRRYAADEKNSAAHRNAVKALPKNPTMSQILSLPDGIAKPILLGTNWHGVMSLEAISKMSSAELLKLYFDSYPNADGAEWDEDDQNDAYWKFFRSMLPETSRSHRISMRAVPVSKAGFDPNQPRNPWTGEWITLGNWMKLPGGSENSQVGVWKLAGGKYGIYTNGKSQPDKIYASKKYALKNTAAIITKDVVMTDSVTAASFKKQMHTGIKSPSKKALPKKTAAKKTAHPRRAHIVSPSNGSMTDDYRVALQTYFPTHHKERMALDSYMGSGHVRVNRVLRKQTYEHGSYGLTPAQVQDQIALLDHVMKILPLPKETTVLRGTSSKQKYSKLLKAGTEFKDDGFVSTSTDSFTADGFSGSDTWDDGKRHVVIMKIIVPKGSKAAYVSSFGSSSYEHELILGRGTTYRVVSSSKKTEKHNGYGFYATDLVRHTITVMVVAQDEN